MHKMTSAQAEQRLADLAEQFAQWRQQRTYRFAPFPCPLWEQAIALTAVLPLAAVAKGLQLRAYSTDFCHPVQRKIATQSMGMLPPSPEDFCHPVHGMLPPSERSDAGLYD